MFSIKPSARQISQYLNASVTSLKTQSIQELVQELEAVTHDHTFTSKFGVLLQRPGQSSEEQILSNCKGSAFYEQFLTTLGHVVQLDGFQHYAGGLDRRESAQSVYSNRQNHEIMFHVGTMMRFDAADEQQVVRKRHIGNDNVVLVFQDGEAVFSTDYLRSNMVYAFVVVQNLAADFDPDFVHYRVRVALKNFVEDADFALDVSWVEGVRMECQQFADFVFRLLLALKAACWRSGDLQMKLDRLKQLKLNQFVQRHQ